MLAAIGPDLNGPSGCNEGFLRDDAILVVTLISDEDDTQSAGDPPDWVNSLVAAKNGQDGVVVLGLIGDLNQQDAVCLTDAANEGGDDATRLRQFVNGMDSNVLGSVCEDNYSTFFESAVDLISFTCQTYPIPQ